jgi:ABC-type lipoprotein export system ATPase subunit
MIQVSKLEKHYDIGSSKSFVLRRIKLEVKQGDFVTIKGPSGAGKSTLEHFGFARQQLVRKVLLPGSSCTQNEAEISEYRCVSRTSERVIQPA